MGGHVEDVGAERPPTGGSHSIYCLVTAQPEDICMECQRATPRLICYYSGVSSEMGPRTVRF